MIALADVVEQLDLLADQVTDRADDDVRQYRFGARILRVHAPRGRGDYQPLAGLVAADGHPGVDLFVLTSTDVARLSFPEKRVGAPYSAVLESLATEWLVTWDDETASLLALHRETRVALWHPGAVPPPRERAEFCRPLLHWLAILDGHVVIHAGAVSTDGHAVLVAGAGNAGKSTLVRACWGAGWDVLGDNVVEVAPAVGGFSLVFPVYPTFKVRPGGVLPIPEQWPRPEWDADARKNIYFLADPLASAFERGPAEHVVTLILDEQRGGVMSNISPGEAFFRVAPNTVAQFPFFEQEALTRVGSVLSGAPHVAAGRIPVADIASVMADLLETARESGARR